MKLIARVLPGIFEIVAIPIRANWAENIVLKFDQNISKMERQIDQLH